MRANPEDPAFMSLCAGLGAFMITPTWRPSDHLPGSTDRRALGVKVGEIERRR